MCSVGDDNFDESENIKYMPSNDTDLSGKCNKCREEKPCIVLRSKDKYCEKCFLAGTVHKFKAMLGKHKLIRPNDRVMVFYKCGNPTTALLHFIRTGLDLDTHKKLRFEPVVLFVEEQLHLSLEERQELLANIEKEVTSYNFPLHFISITQILSNASLHENITNKSNLFKLDENDQTNIDNYLKKQINSTNKNDFLSIRRRQLLIDVAKYLKCKYIFAPDISSDTASQILTDIALGKGSHIPLDTSFCDSRDDEVKILRPLRLFDAKELTFYNHLNNLQPISFNLPQEQTSKSVQSLMEAFVSNLQMNYPATVTTVLKTGDKLSINKSTKKCNLCAAPVGEKKSELTSAESTHFSHWVSTHTPDSTLTPQERYNRLLDTFAPETCDNYCFSCQKLKI